MGRLALLLAAAITLAGCATRPSPDDDGGRRFGGLYGGITGGGVAGR